MKIEIEFKEVENLRLKVRAQEEKIDMLESKIHSLSENELRKKAIQTSYELLDKYISGIFKKLGFDVEKNNSIRITSDLDHYLGDHWPDSDLLSVQIGATITSKFKIAFLNLGIITNDVE